MKIITIDCGNTNSTVGFHENGQLLTVKKIDDETLHQINNDPSLFVLQSIVGPSLPIPHLYPLKNYRTTTHFLDMPVNYSMTLGEDRLCGAYEIYKTIKHNKTLIIDAGSFITVDLVDSQGFQGGFIFPGIKRLIDTYNQSAKLPNLTHDLSLLKETELPHSTEKAIRLASSKMILASLEDIIKLYQPERIVLTGGDALKIRDLINSSTQVDLIHHLVHLGLSQIHQSLISLKLL